ncbi:putative DNA-binding protein [Candidatus Methanoperedens nitroreducens]|uniref:Putative DNA-binding protein n=1 Tax=Candidatus Methanoperedens nitratireducens TaxID=1392998 RepID=A0A062V0S9_9EURY|nr:transposase [Candidatus Methanoperedens nitroreducens]KCZ70952.1 putative DNA-binding protein [Candidatus Methanoperedens nitroreducens]MDJ1421680.1 transposase [Candidatus Methanoperedens sp.]
MTDDDEFNPIEYFQNPKEPAQKRYEALRAYFLESLTQKEAAKRAGYSISTFQSLVSNFQNGKVEFFLKPQYGPNRRQASDFIHERIVSLRKSGYSVYEIKDILSKEGFNTSIQTINRIIKDEGFAKLPRRTREELGITKKNMILPPISTAIDFDQFESYRFECQVGGIYYFIPYILQTGLYELISSAPFPETSKLSKINSIFSILALKLIGHERLSKISSYNHDTGFGFFAGLNVPPKTTTTSTYSYMVDKETIQSFMKEFISQMRTTYSQYYQGDTINLDFHSIPHYGEKSEMNDNWVGAKHQRLKSALTLFAQDGESRHLLYANTDIDRVDESNEIMNFVNYWTNVKGIIEQTLVFDSKLTTYDILEDLDTRDIKFITLRRRGKKLIEDANNIPEKDWIKVDLKKEKRKFNKFKMYESEITLPRTNFKVRQVIFKDHGRQVPTFLVTNNRDVELETLALHYANRWLIENKFSELVDFFNLNALSSPFMIRIYFDVVLTVIADTLYRLLAKDLKRFEDCTPKTIFADVINCRCIGEVVGDEIIIKMKKKATTPIFKSNDVFQKSYHIPWLGNKRIRFDWIS